MTRNLDAIFANGNFVPVKELIDPLPEGTRVRIIVEPINPPDSSDVLSLAAGVYEGLSSVQIAEIERIACDRSSFFTRPGGSAE